MNKPRLLYTSAEIHTRIKRLFGQPGVSDRRIALVAYVGGDGEKYLPHPDGLRLICNPSAGGTDPDTLRQLEKRGARIEISDRLHMKVYWSKNRGCVITSANASSNALGKGDLKEVGIWLPSRIVDVRRLIRYASPRPIREADLRKLDRESRERHRVLSSPKGTKKRSADFLHWYSEPHRKSWKILCVDKVVPGSAKAAKEQSYAEYGAKGPHTWASCGRKQARRSDWLFTFIEGKRGAASIEWMYVDFVVRVGSKERRYYFPGFGYHAVQVHLPSKYPPPPFEITPRFRKAFAAAVKRYTVERMLDAKTSRPPVALLRSVEEEYRRHR